MCVNVCGSVCETVYKDIQADSVRVRTTSVFNFTFEYLYV